MLLSKLKNVVKNSSLLAKFFNDEKLTFATNSANLLTSQLQTCRDLFGSFASIFHLKFRIQFHLFFTYIIRLF
ncbi:hypothetical protein CJ209_10775 [Fusobacterium nucleatum]|uniref:PIN family toxin-antitoxin system n=1 Tax=Fusobacterium nucleatum TaxID=851 RepID=A0A2N6TFH9_FUSNU|nr:hypothetical protein CJ209_10775 [Fusobacterium nucleatum]